MQEHTQKNITFHSSRPIREYRGEENTYSAHKVFRKRFLCNSTKDRISNKGPEGINHEILGLKMILQIDIGIDLWQSELKTLEKVTCFSLAAFVLAVIRLMWRQTLSGSAGLRLAGDCYEKHCFMGICELQNSFAHQLQRWSHAQEVAAKLDWQL